MSKVLSYFFLHEQFYHKPLQLHWTKKTLNSNRKILFYIFFRVHVICCCYILEKDSQQLYTGFKWVFQKHL